MRLKNMRIRAKSMSAVFASVATCSVCLLHAQADDTKVKLTANQTIVFCSIKTIPAGALVDTNYLEPVCVKISPNIPADHAMETSDVDGVVAKSEITKGQVIRKSQLRAIRKPSSKETWLLSFPDEVLSKHVGSKVELKGQLIDEQGVGYAIVSIDGKSRVFIKGTPAIKDMVAKSSVDCVSASGTMKKDTVPASRLRLAKTGYFLEEKTAQIKKAEW